MNSCPFCDAEARTYRVRNRLRPEREYYFCGCSQQPPCVGCMGDQRTAEMRWKSLCRSLVPV